MSATEPMTPEQAMEALIPETQSENETETEAEEVTAEQPEAEDVEVDTDAEVEASFDDEDSDNADEDDLEDEADVEPAQLHAVKVDGEEQQVSYEDLIKGYSGQAYVQKGMSENAAKSKELEATVQTLQSERQAVLQAFQALQSGNVIPQPVPPQIDANEDPIGWTQEQARYQSEMMQYNQQQAAVQQLEAQNTAHQDQASKAYMQEQRAKAVELIPDLGDAEKAPAVMKNLLDVAGSYGYQPDEINGITDARVLAVLKDAASYKALQSSTAKGQKKVEGARPVLKPGAKRAGNKGAAQKAKRAKAMKSQSMGDWADLLIES